MPEYKVYYWVQQGDRGRAVCQSVSAESIDDATRQAQQNLTQHSFVFDSDQDGRVIVVSAHVQFVEVEDTHAGAGDTGTILHIA